MGCGCKKRQQPEQPVVQRPPVNITLTQVQTPTTTPEPAPQSNNS